MPAPYPPEKVEAWKDQICALIAEGKSVQTIAAMEDMPSAVTIYRWLADDGEFVERYTRAREQQADKLAEEILLGTIVDGQSVTVDTEGFGLTLRPGGEAEHAEAA